MLPKDLKPETDTQFESTGKEFSTGEGFVELFETINQALSQQEGGQFNINLTRIDANKIKMDVHSQPNGNGKRILTSDEVCDMLKITRRTLHKYAKMGLIPCFKLGREWRFEADSIFKLFKEM